MTTKPPIAPPSAGPVRAAARAAPPAPPAPQRRAVLFAGIDPSHAGHRVLLYGPGGIGKTTLAAHAPGPVAFVDLDDSLPRLRPQLGPLATAIRTVPDVAAWADLREALQSDGWDAIRTIVIDTATRAEELCAAHVLATVPHEKGHRVQRLEDYGYGKGTGHVFETFLPLLGVLDRHCRAGRNVILVAHDCTTSVPNPAGEDWLRYEPRLQSPASGKASIRLRVREWADHVLFMGYDVNVKDGKGQGAGTRTLYPAELPHCMAKSRTCQMPIPVAGDPADLWKSLFNLSE
jgi:hypothetical protein